MYKATHSEVVTVCAIMFLEHLEKQYGFRVRLHIAVNGRLTKTVARVYPEESEHYTVYMEISKKLLQYDIPWSLINKVMAHEATHQALALQGRNFDDGDEDFENELRKYKLSTCNDDEALTELVHAWDIPLYVYECEGCSVRTYPSHKLNTSKWKCSQCEGHFKFVEDDTSEFKEISISCYK